MENTLKENDYRAVAELLGVETAAIKAVVEVETGGRGGFLPDGRPVILFEGHVFWQRMKLYGLNPTDFMSGNEGVLHPNQTRRFYRGGVYEYDRLERARTIHERAALESASWGLFQIMGFNHEMCGCRSVNEFVCRMGVSEQEQLLLWAEFIRKIGLDGCLRHHKWELFAMRYNGRGYKANRYDKRLIEAYLKHKRLEQYYEETED